MIVDVDADGGKKRKTIAVATWMRKRREAGGEGRIVSVLSVSLLPFQGVVVFLLVSC